jgi:hypothetical protein
LVVAHGPLRAECERLEASLEPLRDAIAALDVAIEGERAALAAFERRYAAALAGEHALLGRIDAWLRHLEGLGRLLADPALRPGERRAQFRFRQKQRDRELAGWHARRLAAKATAARARGGQEEGAGAAGAHAPAGEAERAERMRTTYRQLARRFHPDLAPNEALRARHSDLMAHVNELYARGDEAALTALAGRAEADLAAAPGEGGAIDWPARVDALWQRRAWLSAIVDSLEAERQALSSCQVAELRRAIDREARWQPRDPFANVRADALAMARERLAQVPAAVLQLEQHVKRARSLTRAGAPTALATFDPHVGHELAALGMQGLARRRRSPAAQRWQRRLEDLSLQTPALMRLLLFAYVGERSRQPVEALASFAALSTRFAASQGAVAEPVPLGQALVQGDGLVQYRIDEGRRGLPTLTLGLRDRTLLSALEGCWHLPGVREAFAQVLLHLGGALDCRHCRRQSFEVPLFCLRGLDDLRGTACAHCGALHRRYVLARGEDVQAGWNQAYLDLGLLYECNVTLGRRALGLQVLGRQAATLSARHVLERVSADLFVRNGLQVSARELELCEGERVLAPGARLARPTGNSFGLRGRSSQAGQERAWCDELQYRIRTRYARTPAARAAAGTAVAERMR